MHWFFFVFLFYEYKCHNWGAIELKVNDFSWVYSTQHFEPFFREDLGKCSKLNLFKQNVQNLLHCRMAVELDVKTGNDIREGQLQKERKSKLALARMSWPVKF